MYVAQLGSIPNIGIVASILGTFVVRTKEGGWLYANGEVTTDAAGLEGAILNK